MKKISLEALLPQTDDTQEQYNYIQQMISDGLVKNPALKSTGLE